MRCKLFVGQNGNRLLWLLSGIIMIVFWLSKLIEVFFFLNILKYSISLKNNDNNVKLTPLLTDLYLSHVNTNWSINTVWLFMANIFSNTHLAVCFSYAFKELRDLKFRYWDQKFCNNFKPLWGFETQFVDSPVKMNKFNMLNMHWLFSARTRCDCGMQWGAQHCCRHLFIWQQLQTESLLLFL